MANIQIGAETEKLKKYKGMLQAEVGANTYEYLFIQEMLVRLDDTDVEIDRTSGGSPVFTGFGDVLGTAEFVFKDTVDFAGAAETSDWLKNFWQKNIANRQFNLNKIDFIRTQRADESVGNQYSRERFTARVMAVEEDEERERPVNEVKVELQITAWTSHLREAS